MRISFFSLIAVIGVASAGTLAAQGTFTGLRRPDTPVGGMSADGKIVVGSRSNFGPAFRWTAESGVVDIGGAGPRTRISRDGKTIVSDAKDAQGVVCAAIWESGTRWRTLGGVPNGNVMDGNLSHGHDVSADGSVVVGLAWIKGGGAHAYRWDQQNGMVDLGSLQGESSRANAVSADGNIVVGWDENPYQDTQYNYWRGSIWWQGLERLMNPYGWIGQAEGTNLSGTVIVGRGHPSASRHAYRFTAGDGRALELGALPRGFTPNQKEEEDTSTAYGVSDDAAVVVGSSGWRPPLDAFIWTAETQMVHLSDYLKSKGVTGFEGWVLVVANAVSPDGKIIAGTGINPRGEVEGWIVKLP